MHVKKFESYSPGLSLFLLPFLFLLFCGSSIPLSAAFVHIEDLKTMSHKSEVILHGKVVDQKVREERSGRLITLTEFEVLDGLKGVPPGRMVTLYQVGGELNGKVMRLSSQQIYESGDELMFFGVMLDEMIVSYGPGLGRFNVDRLGQLEGLTESFGDVIALKRDEDGNFIVEHPKPRKFPSLDDFKQEVRGYLNVEGGGFPPLGSISKPMRMPWDRVPQELIR